MSEPAFDIQCRNHTGVSIQSVSHVMHYRAEMTVLLDSLLTEAENEDQLVAAGYIIVIGVNAPSLLAAMKYAHDVALRPRQADGTFRSFEGQVVEAKVQQIEKTDWEPFIQQNARRIDEEGVYYSTGLVFFGPESPDAAENDS